MSPFQHNEASALTVGRPNWTVVITSFFFMLLQNICAFAMAVSSLRTAIGVGALANSMSLIRIYYRFHADIYRIPLIVIAFGGSLLNLYLIWRIRRLRVRPSSQWRMAAPTRSQVRSENIQVALSVITVALFLLEESLHIHFHSL